MRRMVWVEAAPDAKQGNHAVGAAPAESARVPPQLRWLATRSSGSVAAGKQHQTPRRRVQYRELRFPAACHPAAPAAVPRSPCAAAYRVRVEVPALLKASACMPQVSLHLRAILCRAKPQSPPGPPLPPDSPRTQAQRAPPTSQCPTTVHQRRQLSQLSVEFVIFQSKRRSASRSPRGMPGRILLLLHFSQVLRSIR